MSNSSCEALSWSGKASCGVGKCISCALWKKRKERCCYTSFVTLLRLLSIRSFRADLNLLAGEKTLEGKGTGSRKGFTVWFLTRTFLTLGTICVLMLQRTLENFIVSWTADSWLHFSLGLVLNLDCETEGWRQNNYLTPIQYLATYNLCLLTLKTPLNQNVQLFLYGWYSSVYYIQYSIKCIIHIIKILCVHIIITFYSNSCACDLSWKTSTSIFVNEEAILLRHTPQ